MLMSSLTTFLKYFSDVARHKSFSIAARKNFISQSAISQSMKKLELACGFPLFVHDRNRFQLTPKGKALLEKIHPILEQVESIDQCFSDIREEKFVKLHFGCMHSIALAILPRAIAQFREEYPDSEMNFQFGHGGIILDQVKNGELDFGIVLDNEDLSSWHSKPINKGTFEVFSHPSRDSGAFLFSESSYEAAIFKRLYRESYGHFPKVQMKVASWEVIASLADAGVGLGYFPDYLQSRHPSLERVFYPFPSQEYTMVAVFRSPEFVSRPIERFLQVIQENLVFTAS